MDSKEFSVYFRNKRKYNRSLRELVNGRWVATHLKEHGLSRNYTYWCCRCIPCTEAHNLTANKSRVYRYKQRKLIEGRWVAIQVPKERHGIKWTYEHYGCRCIPCSEISSIVRKRKRDRKRGR